MKLILIISTGFDEQTLVEEVIQVRGLGNQYMLTTTASFGQEVEWWIANSPQVLVVVLPEDPTLQGFFFRKLSADIPKDLPVIFTCRGINQQLMQLSTSFNKVKILKSPYSGDDMFRAIVDITTEREAGQQQMHQRYDVIQDVKVEVLGIEGVFDMRVKNISLGGAYVEFYQEDLKIVAGDQLKISIILGDLKKEYDFISRVVWSKPLQAGKGFALGVNFVNRQQELMKLIKKG